MLLAQTCVRQLGGTNEGSSHFVGLSAWCKNNSYWIEQVCGLLTEERQLSILCLILTWDQMGRPLNICDITISGLGNNQVCGLFRYGVAWSMVHKNNWDWSHELKRIKWWVLYPHSLIPGLIGWLSTTFVPSIWYPTTSVLTSSLSGRTGCPDGSSVSPSECHSYK